MPCHRCAVPIPPRRKYCDPCKRAVVLECKRLVEERKRRAAGIVSLAEPGVCRDCGVEFKRTSGARKSCPPCGTKAKEARARLARAAYEERNKGRPFNKDPEKAREARRRWAQRNPEAARIRSAAYNEKNRELVNAKARSRNGTPERRRYAVEWERQKRASDPVFVLNTRMRQAVRRHLAGGKAGRRWRDMVGYGPGELKAHLERQFTLGMTWENIGDWHVDHIVPLVSFDYQSADDPAFRAAWALTNLRPLWGRDNVRKGGKRLTLL